MSFDLSSFMKFQIEEINKHKYIESEKAGKDLGNMAVNDWIKRYAHPVKQWAITSGRFNKSE